jgi:hypothetical protein
LNKETKRLLNSLILLLNVSETSEDDRETTSDDGIEMIKDTIALWSVVGDELRGELEGITKEIRVLIGADDIGDEG